MNRTTACYYLDIEVDLFYMDHIINRASKKRDKKNKNFYFTILHFLKDFLTDSESRF